MHKRFLISFLVIFFLFPSALCFPGTDAQETTGGFDPRGAGYLWRNNVATLGDSVQTLMNESLDLLENSERLKAEIKLLEGTSSDITAEQERLRQEPARLNSVISDKQERIKTIGKDMESLRRELGPLEQSGKALAQQSAAIDRDRQLLEGQKADLLRYKESLELEISQAKSSEETQANQLRAQVEETKSLIEQARSEKDTHARQLEETKKEYGLLQDEVRPMKAENAKLSIELTRTQKSITQIGREVALLQSKDSAGDNEAVLNSHLQQKQKIEQQIQTTQANIEQAQEKMESQKAALEEMSQRTENLKEEINQYQVDNHLLKAKVDDFQAIIESLQRQNAMIESLLDLSQP